MMKNSHFPTLVCVTDAVCVGNFPKYDIIKGMSKTRSKYLIEASRQFKR